MLQKSMRAKKRVVALYLLVPLIVYVFSVFVPLITAFVDSFFEWKGGPQKTFNGIQNYITLFQDATFWQSFWHNIYLVATSAMDLFRAIDGIDNIRLSGTKENGWYIQEAKDAMEAGDMIYAGKYNAPDYELILNEGCDLAIESTMIHHNPEVQEKLEQFGIPVMVERSSYEPHPLGRTEWMKLYAVLLGKEDVAETTRCGS